MPDVVGCVRSSNSSAIAPRSVANRGLLGRSYRKRTGISAKRLLEQRKTAETVDAGGGTRTPDTRIMIAARFDDVARSARCRGHGRGHIGRDTELADT